MDEDELERLREEKRKELEEQPGSEEQEADRKDRIKKQASKYLTSEAQSRLGNVRAADPEKASAIEMQLARLGELGRIEENEVTEERLKQILRELGQESQDQGDIKFRR